MKQDTQNAKNIYWPLRHLPVLTTAGKFPLDDYDFRIEYLSKIHALHIHLYHGVVKIGSHFYVLAPGDVTFSPAGLKSSYALPQAGYHWCVHFQPAGAKQPRRSKDKPGRAASDAFLTLPRHFSTGVHRDFAVERMRHISQLYARGKLTANPAAAQVHHIALAAASAALQETLLWLATIAHSPPSGSSKPGEQGERAIEQLVGILQTRFTEPLCVEDLADTVELSQNYLARRFKERFGMTIPHYLLVRRMEHARVLLADTNMPIHRIAQRVGLPDPQYFNKQFRRFAGRSPSVYRAERLIERSPD